MKYGDLTIKIGVIWWYNDVSWGDNWTYIYIHMIIWIIYVNCQEKGILEYVDRVAALPVPKLACKIRAFRQRHRSYANGKSVQDGAPKVAFSCLINDFTDITWYNYSYWESKWFINQLIFGGGHPVPVAEKSVNTLSVYHDTHKCSRILWTWQHH